MTDVFKMKENHMSWNLYTFIQVDKKGFIYLKMFGTSCGVMLYVVPRGHLSQWYGKA